MSAVTLESLRADFEAAYHEVGGPSPLGLSPEYVLEELDGTFAATGEWWRWSARVRSLATTYIIARDHGLTAAMLFKLSDGAIDPREEVRDDG